ncbi:HEAT repeat domain-containing protein [Streptomyces sp. 549]|uniref:HEAT repeat domain-containing protein n=1 Tax=Streptomyces sp. 549 TaxID=3049076 RepID=UPI0024C370E6|nr:HEAT repeat domain-containing protein [Streptomyces sp. 549]MDK1472763.1 HEAT repeat domain-containing protein [Streptomyces sp. 549]
MPTADELLGTAEVERLRAALAEASGAELPALRQAAAALHGLGLGDRARALRDALLTDLPADYPALDAVVRRALKDPEFGGWLVWPLSEAVADRATAPPRQHLGAGLRLTAELTGRLTCEYALRTFLTADLHTTLAAAREWTTHPDEHVRRLASEGTRPLLPWARRVPGLQQRPELVLPLLDALHRDPSEYVRRSVANHLNDISRAHPELAVATAARWLEHPDPHTPKVVRHALRTLVKRGDAAALALLGFVPAAGLRVTGPVLGARSVAVGEMLPFTVTVANDGDREVRLAVDYVVHHRKADGSSSEKVFKLTTRTLAAGAELVLERRHSFRPITTRRYHPGEHAMEVQINGSRSGLTTFQLHVG